MCFACKQCSRTPGYFRLISADGTSDVLRCVLCVWCLPCHGYKSPTAAPGHSNHPSIHLFLHHCHCHCHCHCHYLPCDQDMTFMFQEARRFSCNLSAWETLVKKNKCDTTHMFLQCPARLINSALIAAGAKIAQTSGSGNGGFAYSGYRHDSYYDALLEEAERTKADKKACAVM